MRKIFLLWFGWLLMTQFLLGDSQHKKEIKRRNIDQFLLVAYPTVHETSDSIRVIAFLRIPNYALQFVKRGHNFQAQYEVNLSVQDTDGRQVLRKIWQDSITVSNYLSTTSRLENVTLVTEFNIPPGKYHLIGNLMDLDTKNIGEYTRELEWSKYRGDIFLLPPVILIDREGYWGFESGKIPSLSNSIKDISQELLVEVSGSVNPGNFTITSRLKAKGEGQLWKDEKTISVEEKHFSQKISIPASVLEGISFSLEVILKQGNKKLSETINFSIQKPGVSRYISDINEALDQMQYILTNEERAELKQVRSKERERLFKAYWESRDPTPNTFHNELMEEYYRRIAYANEHFTGFQSGWRSDMGMIYILFGAPDDVERSNLPRERKTYETWYYYRINQSFIFVDENGFGDYRLKTPYYGYPR